MSTSELQPTQSSGTLERIEQLVRELLGDETIVLTADTRPSEVDGWDSLANVNIVFGLEEEFQVRLGDEVVTGFEHVGELASLVDRARAAAR
jgi:acyl carrier protein